MERITQGRMRATALGLSAAAGLILAATLPPAAAQDRNVTRADYEMAHKFSEENLKKMIFDLTVVPEWIDGTDTFWYRWETSRDVRFYLVDPGRRKIADVFDNSVMAAALTKLLGKPFDPARLPIATLAFRRGAKTFQFSVGDAFLEFDRTTGALTKLSGAAAADEASPFNAAQMKAIREFTAGGVLRGPYLCSPDGRWQVFARKQNLFVIDAKDPAGKEYALTTDGEDWNSYDFANEDGHLKDAVNTVFFTWLPDGHRFFLKRTDRRKVRDLWLLQPLSKPFPTLKTYKRSLPGDECVDQDELWIFDCETKAALRVKADRWRDQAIGGKAQDNGVYAVPDGEGLYFIRTDRTWSKIDFAVADVRTGDVRTIIAEEILPNVTPTSSQVKVIDKGREIIWWSNRDGWGHYYLYDGQGRLKNRITSGDFCCRSIVRVDAASRTLYFTASGREAGVDPYYEYLYRIGLDGKGLECLTPENANHPAATLSMSESGKYFVDNPSRVDRAPEAVVRDASGRNLLTLASPDLSRLREAGWKAPETFKVKAADNVTDLYGVMWKPFDFDPGRKYPLVMLTYPGPISEVVPKSFDPLTIPGTGLCQLGFVVVWFGNRGGSAERSKAYNDFSNGNMRDFGSPDKKYGLEQLAAAHPFIDADRIGVMGGSGGGFQTTTLMLTYPDFFKVGVCWAGNNDNSLMENYWPELNNGVQEITENGRTRFVVDAPSVLDLAKNLKGHFLIMHGLQDNRVHPAITYRVVQALIEADKPFDMYIIPDEQHQFTRGRYRPYIMRIIWQYFAEHLMGDPRSKVDVFGKYDAPLTAKP